MPENKLKTLCFQTVFGLHLRLTSLHTHSVSSALIVRFKMVEQHISIIVTKGSAISGAKRGNGDSNEEDQHEGHEETVHHSHRHGAAAVMALAGCGSSGTPIRLRPARPAARNPIRSWRPACSR